MTALQLFVLPEMQLLTLDPSPGSGLLSVWRTDHHQSHHHHHHRRHRSRPPVDLESAGTKRLPLRNQIQARRTCEIVRLVLVRGM